MTKRPSENTIEFSSNTFRCYYPAIGAPVDVFELKSDVYTDITEFNYLYIEYGSFFNSTRDSDAKVRLDKSKESNLLLLKRDLDIERAFTTLRFFARLGEDYPYNDLKEAESLIEAYTNIFRRIQSLYDWTKSDAYIVPLRGGGIIAELFKFPPKKVIHLNAKRLPLKAKVGDFSFGLDAGYGPYFNTPEKADAFMQNLNNKEVTILEICIASGMTSFAFLIDLYLKGVRPRVLNILTSAMSYQGYKLVSSFAKELGIPVRFLTAKVSGKLADHYHISQDTLLDEDMELLVVSPAKAYKRLMNQA